MPVILTLVTIAVGLVIAGAAAAATAVIASYGGMLGPVRCYDPNVSACTGLYYYYGTPGYAPLLACLAGLALAGIGVAVLLRSRGARTHT